MSQFTTGHYGPSTSYFQAPSPMAMTLPPIHEERAPQLPGAVDLPDTDGSLVGKAAHHEVRTAEVTSGDFEVARQPSNTTAPAGALTGAPTQASIQTVTAQRADPQPEAGSRFECSPSVFNGLGYVGAMGAGLAGSITCCATSVPLGLAIGGYGGLASGSALIAGGTCDALAVRYPDHCPVSAHYEPEDHPVSTCAAGTFLGGMGATVLGILGLTPGSVYCAFSLPCAICLAMFGCTERTPYRCA